jgi:hypothetical protein
MRYRRVGDREWRQGKTENISRSGVLFRAKECVEVDEDVELCLELPIAGAGSKRPEVTCRGRVVRTVSPSDTEPWPGSAIMIEQYDFVPPPANFMPLSAY